MDEKKVREAIFCMKSFIDETVCEECDQYERCDHTIVEDNAKIAIEALEKQLPKKPIEHPAKFAAFYECPSCGDVDVYGQKNCDNCGQRLDWSE